MHLVSCGRCRRRQLSLLALVDGCSWGKRRTCPAGDATNCAGTRDRACWCIIVACAAPGVQLALPQPPPSSQPTTQRSRNLRRLAQRQQPSRPPERPYCAVRRHRSRHPPSPSACERLAWHLRHPLGAPSQPAPDVEAAQLPQAKERRLRRRAPDCCSAPCRMHFS